MKTLRLAPLVAVIIAGLLGAFALLVLLAVLARGGLQVAVGYSAKQMCSGVFVSGLPESFVWERDIWPRAELFGPLRHGLEVRSDLPRGLTEASLLGVSAQAVHLADRGCVLHGEGPGAPPRRNPGAAEPVGVPDALQDVYRRAFDEPVGRGRNTLALLVSHNGRLLAEQYVTPVSAATPLQGWSMNKSLLATWIGMLAAAGELDPTLPLRTLIYKDPAIDALDERLTLLHLLQMESGLDFDEAYAPWGDVTRMLYREKIMWQVPASVEQRYPPGRRFSYSSGDSVLAAMVWQRSLGTDYVSWLEERFIAPLQLSLLVAESDSAGMQVGSSYAYLTARDWLAVGQLWLDAWHGRSDLLPQSWLRDSVRVRKSDRLGRYGRGFWLNTGRRSFPGAPESTFYASGNAGQYVIVIPEWDMVVVRLGLTRADSSSGAADFIALLANRLGELGAAPARIVAGEDEPALRGAPPP